MFSCFQHSNGWNRGAARGRQCLLHNAQSFIQRCPVAMSKVTIIFLGTFLALTFLACCSCAALFLRPMREGGVWGRGWLVNGRACGPSPPRMLHARRIEWRLCLLAGELAK